MNLSKDGLTDPDRSGLAVESTNADAIQGKTQQLHRQAGVAPADQPGEERAKADLVEQPTKRE